MAMSKNCIPNSKVADAHKKHITNSRPSSRQGRLGLHSRSRGSSRLAPSLSRNITSLSSPTLLGLAGLLPLLLDAVSFPSDLRTNAILDNLRHGSPSFVGLDALATQSQPQPVTLSRLLDKHGPRVLEGLHSLMAALESGLVVSLSIDPVVLQSAFLVYLLQPLANLWRGIGWDDDEFLVERLRRELGDPGFGQDGRVRGLDLGFSVANLLAAVDFIGGQICWDGKMSVSKRKTAYGHLVCNTRKTGNTGQHGSQTRTNIARLRRGSLEFISGSLVGAARRSGFAFG